MEYEYFDLLKIKLEEAYAVASEARSKGFDPEKEVEIKIAKDVAARVEGIVGPPGICDIIRNMEKTGLNRETIAFEVAKKIAIGEVIKGTAEERIEQAVRTGVAILTEGVLVAPTEGISKINIKKNPDGSEYVSVYYSGPIRSAGGTAAALSVVLADIARKAAGIADYRATDSQIERYVEEVNIYEGRIAHLQYKPPDEDVRWISRNCPVCIDGEPTGDIEASVHRNIAGVETNRIRGGIPLVICEGIAQKAAKVFKYTKKLGLEWDWLEKIIKVTRKADKIEIKPDSTYLEGLVAGRPVFAYPSTKGGFRLRYGRSRTNGIMAKNIHPAIMVLLDGFLAYGTHMKIERPGKGCVISSCDGIEPPIIKLKNGSVVKVNSLEEAEKLKNDIDSILFLGDMLVPFGDFLKSNHPLIPGGWCEEWWLKEVEAKGVVPSETAKSDALEAFDFSKKHNVPLHPNFTFNWENIHISDLKILMKLLASGEATFDNGKIVSFKLAGFEGKKYLEALFIEHNVKDGKEIWLNGEDATALLITMGMLNGTEIKEISFDETVTEETIIQQILERICGVHIKIKAPTYIGARMGRPEKAKERPMDGSPNVLFPTGSQKNRSIAKLYKTLKSRDGEKTTILELARYRCKNCNKITFNRNCTSCHSETELQRICAKCNAIVDKDIHCDFKTVCYDKRPVDIVEIVEEIKKMLGGIPEDVKGVKGLSNPTRIPERLEKGFLRAKYEVFVFRDGTSRFDATDVPLTHFMPKEIGLSLEKAIELGYTKDYLGNNLTSDSQLVPLKHQDVLLSKRGAEYFFKVSKFIDEMLVYLYGLKPFYNLESEEDLIGHMAAGLSPHTSAAALCRIVGITEANVGYAHPYFHTAKRRNCFYPNTKINIATETGEITETIRDITERMTKENPEKIKKFDDGTIKIELEQKWFISSICPKSRKIIKRRIKCFMKTVAPEYWIKIYTNQNEMIVTPDHNVLCIERGELKAIEADNVKEGMLIPIKMKSESSDDKKIFTREIIAEPIIKIEKMHENKSAYCLDIETETNNLIEKNILLENGIFCIRCDGDEDCLILLMDALINFSRKYLGDTRGGTMDTPLVMTSAIDPREVDDEVHCMELVTSYPLDFYMAAEKKTFPGEIKIKTIKDVLGTLEQFGQIPITHHCSTIDKGITRTNYVRLDSIPEKIEAQFALQGKIDAVDQKDAAERLILSHFIPDLYGNLRSFSRQTFRCVNCNESYRRVPLAGKCVKCGGNLLLTINKGGIKKYLEISKRIVEEYKLPDYLKQRLDLLDKEIKNIFEDDKIKQMGLSDFV